jgi:uncharacterized Tic20 family protein
MRDQQDLPPAGSDRTAEAGEPPGAPQPPPSGRGLGAEPGLPPPGHQAPGTGPVPPPPGPGAPPPGYGPPPGYPPPPVYGQPPPWQVVGLQPEEERVWSTLTHLSFFVFGIIVPLIIMLTLGNRSAYVRHHAVEALNFHITIWIAGFIAGLSILLVVGVVLLPAVLIAAAVFTVIAAVRAYQGALYRYPLSIRLVR